MTKKDYVLIARAIKVGLLRGAEDYKVDKNPSVIGAQIISSLALELSTENPKFDVRKFYKICNPIKAV